MATYIVNLSYLWIIVVHTLCLVSGFLTALLVTPKSKAISVRTLFGAGGGERQVLLALKKNTKKYLFLKF